MGEHKKSLRAVSPKLHLLIMSELESKYNIQPYDVQAEAIKKDKGIQVLLKFGERFTHQEEQYFPFSQIRKESKVLDAFIQSSGEACKEVMIQDYYRMMAP